MPDIKHIDIKEFRERGYLQEANRRFFHPLGLALETTICDNCGGSGYEPGSNNHCQGLRLQEGGCDGKGEWISGVWDYREDPEGITFDGIGLDVAKADAIDDEFDEHAGARIDLLGQVIQPVERKIPHE